LEAIEIAGLGIRQQYPARRKLTFIRGEIKELVTDF